MQITEEFLQSALDALKQEIFSSMRVAMPGIIEDYDPSTGMATIQPSLRRRTSVGQILTAPLLHEVPVLRPVANMTINPGSPCLLIFADFCLDGFLEARQPVIPPSLRQHDLSDAIAIVGYFGPSPLL